MLKKVTLALAVTGLMAGMAFAGSAPQTGINGSKHDMNKYGQDDTYGRTCVFCHTPHNALNKADAPLWNRADGTTNVGTYAWVAPANKTALGASVGTPLAGPTQLCLSCHDGSVAPDSHRTLSGGAALTTQSTKISDLSLTHPVGFSYTAAQAARPTEIVAADATNTFLGAVAFGGAANAFDTQNVTRTGGRLIKDVMYGATNIMTCASCHEVHNTNNAINTVGSSVNFLLNAPEDGSAICLSCHIK